MSGGGGSQITGYWYALGMEIIFSQGGLDSVTQLKYGGRTFWTGNVSDNTEIKVSNLGLFGGEKKEGGVEGTISFRFGGDGQPVDAYVAYYSNYARRHKPGNSLSSHFLGLALQNTIRGPETPLQNEAAAAGMTINEYLISQGANPVPANREVQGIILKAFIFAANNPYMKNLSAVVRKCPTTLSSSYSVINLNGRYNANPAHVIYSVLTNDLWGLGIPASGINGDSLLSSAQVLYSEGFGLSMQWTNEDIAEKFIDRILEHIDAVRYKEPTNNKFVLKLIRDDYDVNSIFVADNTNVRSVVRFERSAMSELVNEVSVVYIDPEQNKETKQTVQNLGAIGSLGRVIRQVTDYTMIRDADLATRVAERDLATASFPFAKAQLIFDRSAIGLRPGSVFKFNWSSKTLTANDVIFRVIEVSLGDDQSGDIEVIAVEDKFSLPEISYAKGSSSDWVPEDAALDNIQIYDIFETPYYLLIKYYGEDFATYLSDGRTYAAVMAGRTNRLWDSFDMMELSNGDYVKRATGGFTAWCTVDDAIGLVSVDNETINVSFSTSDGMESVVAGWFAYHNDEILLITSIDIENQLLTLSRAVLDTIPTTHDSASSFIVFKGTVLIDNNTVHGVGESSTFKLVPKSSSGSLDIDSTTSHGITYVGRQFLPYPPGQVKLNGAYYPSTIDGPLVLTWAHRDRTQQTGDTPASWSANSITSEAGVTYTVSLYDGATFIREYTGITDNTWTYPNADVITDGSLATITVKLKSVRDAEDCLYIFSHTVNRTSIS